MSIINKSFLLFVIALIVRVVYVWFFVELDNLFLEDQSTYINLGKSMYETGDFLISSNNSYMAVTDRLIGYPSFLYAIYSVFGENNMAVILVQIVIDSLTCVIIALFVESIIFGGFLIAGVLSALNLNMINLSGMILTDTLFLFVFSLFILLVVNYIKNANYIKLVLAVSILSVSALIRPVSYYFIIILLPMMIVFLVRKGSSFKKIFISLMLYIIPVTIAFGSIHYRNYYEFNSYSLTSQNGGHTLHWVVPSVYQYSGQGSFTEGQELSKKYLENAMIRDDYTMSDTNEFENSSYKIKISKELFESLGFLNILKSWSVGAIINLLAPSVSHSPAVRSIPHPSFYRTPGNGIVEKLINYVTNTNGLLYLSIIFTGLVLSLIFVIVTIYGLYTFIKYELHNSKNKEVFIFLLLVVSYFVLITGPVVGVKYRLPIEPVFTLFFSYAIMKFNNKLV